MAEKEAGVTEGDMKTGQSVGAQAAAETEELYTPEELEVEEGRLTKKRRTLNKKGVLRIQGVFQEHDHGVSVETQERGSEKRARDEGKVKARATRSSAGSCVGATT